MTVKFSFEILLIHLKFVCVNSWIVISDNFSNVLGMNLHDPYKVLQYQLTIYNFDVKYIHSFFFKNTRMHVKLVLDP